MFPSQTLVLANRKEPPQSPGMPEGEGGRNLKHIIERGLNERYTVFGVRLYTMFAVVMFQSREASVDAKNQAGHFCPA
jgi:hypothetical protein